MIHHWHSTYRGVPSHLINGALDKGLSLFVRNKDILFVCFIDKNDVYVLKSCSEAAHCEKKNTWLEDKYSSITTCITLKFIIT